MQNSVSVDASRTGTINLPDLRVVSVTEDRKLAFFHLLQEQAAQHGVHSLDAGEAVFQANRLFNTAIVQGGINAFLVVEGEQAMCTVTYTDCLGVRGRGLYLEDIVTTEAARGKGVGHFAMRHLAEIAVGRDAQFLQWECAENNSAAHRFYNSFDAAIDIDVATWRMMGVPQVRPTEDYVCMPMQAADIPQAAEQLAWCNGASQGQWRSWLGREIAADNDDFVHIVARHAANGRMVGVANMRRGFSTFRMENGAHIDTFATCERRAPVTQALLAACTEIQQRRGWTGHLDMTLPTGGQPGIAESVESHGLRRLAYNSKMVVRSMNRAQLELLARPLQEPHLFGSAVRSEEPSRLRIIPLTLAAA